MEPLVGLTRVAAGCAQHVMAAQVLIGPGQFLRFGRVVERRRQAVDATLFPFGSTAQGPQRGLQASGQRHKAFARIDGADVEPTAICQGELVQEVREHGPIKLDLEFIGSREVRQSLSPWRVFLHEVALSLGAELGAPQT